MKRQNAMFLVCCFVLLLTANPVPADEFVFGTFPIPLMVVDSHHGVFVDLTKQTGARAGLDITLSVQPPLRTVKGFGEGKLDCFFPALDVMLPPGLKVLKSENIYIKKDYVFTRKGTPLLKTLEDLKGKKVGITRGYPYVRDVTESTTFTVEFTNSDENNAKKLIAGRIDAFVVEEKSGLQAFKKMGVLTSIQYDKTRPLSEQDVYFAFHDDMKGRDLENKFSAAMRAMKTDGTFSDIMAQAK